MAEIRPLRAFRYKEELNDQIGDLVSPLFDVVSEKQRNALYKNPLNSIHLSVPKGENASNDAQKLLEQWKSERTIIQEDKPAIYGYYQHFSLPGSTKEYVRKGFICNIRVYDWDEEIILRHENTIPHSVNDRLELIEKTQLNVSPTHGLYTDENHTIEDYLDASMSNPVYETEDYQGVKDVLSVIDDPETIKKVINIIRDKKIILADGHHRYEGSLAYMKSQRESNPNHTGNEGYNFHMMYLTNTESDDLRILPTHRLVRNVKDFSEEWLLKQLEEYFIIKTVENAPDVNEIILGKKWAFGLLVGDNAYKIRLKPEKIDEIYWNFPQKIKEADLTVMHFFIFEKILGIPGKNQRDSEFFYFERNFTECLYEVIKGIAQFAIITKDVPIETVKEVCYTGYTMPQKSTYFYPKVICGYVFGSIQENEFNTPADLSF
ncbi:MAG: DUF1015 domain-containing protein [bacterium]|nr:DUF1015 domain-containing protein [bacterium]